METQEDLNGQLSFARSYQIEALEEAMKQNTIVFLETGSGKTLIAIMLLRSYAHLLRRPIQSYIAVFLVPTVVLVYQQAEVIEMHTDLKVGKYWGEKGVDFWDAATWKEEQKKHEVLVMTPKILLDALSHSYIKLSMIKVLIFDECHNARGKHPYACIMKEFYHRQLDNNEVPRIFGMTASPIKTKAKGSDSHAYWRDISALENLMKSKVYTCVSEDVLAKYISFPKAKFQYYDEDIPNHTQLHLSDVVSTLTRKHMSVFRSLELESSMEESLCNKFKKLSSTFHFCLLKLGIWPALKASEVLSSQDSDIFTTEKLDIRSETTIKAFHSDVVKELFPYIPSGFNRTISDVKANPNARLLTSKVLCLVESIIQYRLTKNLKCIIFVQRVITAMVLGAILDELLSETFGWRTRYVAGNNSQLKSQSRIDQNHIVGEFRSGAVNILVSTSILEEGLDVQSCNLVVRFDPSANVCSFIQSRGRARMLNSDFVLMVKRGDEAEFSRMEKYLLSGDMMRKESLNHASVPCQPIEFNKCDEIFYRVPSTGATVTLSYSVSLIYFYCSRLPCDGYFKPYPHCTINEILGTCTLRFPNSCPIQQVTVEGDKKILKQLACLEACKELHRIGALTDSLVPDVVEEKSVLHELEDEVFDETVTNYIPPELIGNNLGSSDDVYHCYVMKLDQNFHCDTPVHDMILVLKAELDSDIGNLNFDMEVDWGTMSVHLKYNGQTSLTNEQVLLCKQFQVAVFRTLKDRNYNKLVNAMRGFYQQTKDDEKKSVSRDYLILPCHWLNHSFAVIDWKCIGSVSHLCNEVQGLVTSCTNQQRAYHDDVYTKNGFVGSSVLENCLVCTPHNGFIYCISGVLDGVNGNSLMRSKDGESITYKSYYKLRHGINLHLEEQALLCGRQVFLPRNYLLRYGERRKREPSDAYVELPPEICVVIMSPISVAILHSFSFLPSIMHRVESLLLSANLRSLIVTRTSPNIVIPATKVLEAITTKNCGEEFDLESLETLGDSFLKYAVSQKLFKTHQDKHEGLLSINREKIVSNAALRKLGYQRNIPGFIRNESCDPKKWEIPGDVSENSTIQEVCLSTTRKIYSQGTWKIKGKRVADVVEALIGAFLSSGCEAGALLFMNWVGIEVDFSFTMYRRNFPAHPHKYVNITSLESLLKYTFKDPSLLVEALTHGSYMLPDIPRCYQRLEFLGDAVLDHLITIHLYEKYPGLSPGLLTDLRSASVNNDCYAQSAVRAKLHKHILYASQMLHKQMASAVAKLKEVTLESTFGWDSVIDFPKVLADIIESLAGAIFVDSGYDKDVVGKSIMPLLEPMVTPQTLKPHPINELTNLCHKHHFNLRKPIKTRENGLFSVTMEVEADGVIYSHTCNSSDKKIAMKLASKALLESMKESIPLPQRCEQSTT